MEIKSTVSIETERERERERKRKREREKGNVNNSTVLTALTKLKLEATMYNDYAL